jgi:hypothetical protein
MAQSGYTPITLYSSTTASNVPLAANLATGELAINVADGKLFYKNTSGVVTQLVGLSGYSGGSGGAGTSGYSGYSGLGLSGYSGYSGTNGTIGVNGTSGYSGFSGLSGYSGATGPSGYSGPTGAGTSGFSGFSGFSGVGGGSILTTANSFTNTNTFAGNVAIGSTVTSNGTLYVKGGNSNNLLLDNAGQQFTTLSIYNNGTQKSQIYWDQTNTLFVLGTDVSAPVVFKTATVERMRVTSTGGVSIGTSTDPGQNNLLVNGDIQAAGNITAYYSSDAKFKENVKSIDNALGIVSAIGGKEFDWTDDYINAHGGVDGYYTVKKDFGVIAQDVQKVFPKAVRTRPDGSLAVDYTKLGVLAFAAILELLERIKVLEAE